MIILSLIFAVAGYLFGLHLPIIAQVVIVAISCYYIFNSKEFQQAELGQVLYMVVVALFFCGAALGNIVYFIAHARDPSVVSLMQAITHAFQP